jgi:hypothetical protein
MTIPEFLLLQKIQIDKIEELEYDRHWRAYLNFAATGKKKVGKKIKPRFDKFEKFYNRKKIRSELHGTKQKSAFADLIAYKQKKAEETDE